MTRTIEVYHPKMTRTREVYHLKAEVRAPCAVRHVVAFETKRPDFRWLKCEKRSHDRGRGQGWNLTSSLVLTLKFT